MIWVYGPFHFKGSHFSHFKFLKAAPLFLFIFVPFNQVGRQPVVLRTSEIKNRPFLAYLSALSVSYGHLRLVIIEVSPSVI